MKNTPTVMVLYHPRDKRSPDAHLLSWEITVFLNAF